MVGVQVDSPGDKTGLSGVEQKQVHGEVRLWAGPTEDTNPKLRPGRRENCWGAAAWPWVTLWCRGGKHRFANSAIATGVRAPRELQEGFGWGRGRQQTSPVLRRSSVMWLVIQEDIWGPT